MSHPYEINYINDVFVKDLDPSDQVDNRDIFIEVFIVFDDLALSENFYNQVEMMYLQVFQDIDEHSDFALNLIMNFSFESYSLKFLAKTGVSEIMDGLSKSIEVEMTDISSEDFNFSLFNYMLTNTYAKYYQKEIKIFMAFSDGLFLLDLYPEEDEYAILFENDIEVKIYMSDYIKSYDQIQVK